MENTHAGKRCRPVDAISYSYSTTGQNILLKLLYLYLQHELPENEVYDFYLQFPEFLVLPEKEHLSFFERLFNECAPGPFTSTASLISALEKYLYSKNIDFHNRFQQFIESSLKFRPDYINQSIFEHFRPVLQQINLKDVLLSKAYLLPPIIMADATSEMIQLGKNGSETYAMITILSRNPEPLAIDSESGIGSIFRFFPLLFGLSPFSSFKIIAQQASVSHNLNHYCTVNTSNDFFFVDSERIGIIIDFGTFIHNINIPYQKQTFQSVKVYVPEKDYYCKKRKRIILRKNCAYGAPFSIIRLSHSHDTPEESKPIGFSAAPQNRIWAKIEQKHEELLSLLNTSLYVTFNRRLQSISVNGVFITSGVQAKILCAIFRLYVKKGHSEFEWNEFAAEKEFICDPYSTGLSTRLKRAMNCLSKVTKDIVLEKYGRGKYRLLCKKKLYYSEV